MNQKAPSIQSLADSIEWAYRGALGEFQVELIDLLQDALGLLQRLAAGLRQRSQPIPLVADELAAAVDRGCVVIIQRTANQSSHQIRIPGGMQHGAGRIVPSSASASASSGQFRHGGRGSPPLAPPSGMKGISEWRYPSRGGSTVQSPSDADVMPM